MIVLQSRSLDQSDASRKLVLHLTLLRPRTLRGCSLRLPHVLVAG